MSNTAEQSSDFSAAEIEAGRRLFTREWNFVSAASSLASLPPMAGPEIAFAGRSNVGKSSLINALTGRKALARTSHTPGRTQDLIFFAPAGAAAEKVVLVDMPGYGYAAASKSKIGAWTALIHEFLRGRATLTRVYLLIDSRHGLMTADQDILRTLDQAAVSYQIVLTKADRVGAAELGEQRAAVALALARRPAAFPEILATSSQTGAGLAELRAAIGRLLKERA